MCKKLADIKQLQVVLVSHLVCISSLPCLGCCVHLYVAVISQDNDLSANMPLVSSKVKVRDQITLVRCNHRTYYLQQWPILSQPSLLIFTLFGAHLRISNILFHLRCRICDKRFGNFPVWDNLLQQTQIIIQIRALQSWRQVFLGILRLSTVSLIYFITFNNRLRGFVLRIDRFGDVVYIYIKYSQF